MRLDPRVVHLSRVCVRLKGKTDHESLVALENAAIASLAVNRFADARQHLETLLDRLRHVYGGGSNLRTLSLSLQLARLLVQDKQVDKALALYLDCLTLSVNLLGYDHELTTSCSDGLGKCFFLLGDFEVRPLARSTAVDTLLTRL